MRPKEKGPCVDFVDRFYFDIMAGKCLNFKFGGCHGNTNNFETVQECSLTCETLMSQVINAPIKTINMSNF